ncbi:MAG: GNAT family N-acetyltransferase [Promethearchaeota archaeon]
MHPIYHTVTESELDRRLALNSTEMLQSCAILNENLQSNPNFISALDTQSIDTISQKGSSKIIRFLQKKGFPFTWSKVPTPRFNNIEGFLKDQQSAPKFEISNMFLDITSGSCPQQLLKRTKVIKAYKPEHFNQFYDILRDIFDYPADIIENFKNKATSSHPFFQQTDHYIGLLHNEPISIGLVYYSNGIAGIYWVGVKNEHRKQGLGSCMMFQLLKQIRKKGYRYSGLQSTPSSHNVYREMGFQDISKNPKMI